MKNEALQTLYSNLVRGAYALDGSLDGEFLADLLQRIPFKPRAADWQPTGALALIPASRVAGLLAEIAWHEDAIQEVVDDMLDPDSGSDPEWEITPEDVDEPTPNVEMFWELSDGLADCRAKLAAA
jgi:hypothetical protein